MSRSFFGIASVIAGLTLLSKALGFGRELVIAGIFGADVAKDAYTAAYIIPSFALIMLGGLTGPFHTATQRVLATLREGGAHDEAPSVLGAVAVWVTIVMGLLATGCYVLAPMLIGAVASQASPEMSALAVQQLRIMSPLVLLGGWIGVLCGISNDQHDFARPALSPLVASVVIIVAILMQPSPLVLAYGTLLGGIGQVLLQTPAAFMFWRETKISLSKLPYRHPAVRSVWTILLPACISSGVGTLSVIIGTNFASALAPGSISVFDFANKLIQLPLGILMTALLIPIFPLLTKAVVKQDDTELGLRLSQGLSTIAIATFPLTAIFVVSGYPLVRVIFERGAFDRMDTHATALILGILAAGIAAYAARDLIVRVFYAHNDGRTPLFVSAASLTLTAGGMAAVVKPFGLPGLAAISVAVTFFNCMILIWLLRRKFGNWRLPGLTRNVGWSFLAALIAGSVTHATMSSAAWENTIFDCWKILTLQVSTLLLLYGGVLHLAGIPALQTLRLRLTEVSREKLARWRH